MVLAALCASCAWPAAAQVANPPTRQATSSGNDSAIVPDGVTFYRGQTFLLRNGRAALVDDTLVPEGKVLTRAGRLVAMPPELTGRPEARNQITPPVTSDAVQDGIVHMRGKSYLVRGTSLQPIDSKLIPEGSVLNATNTLSSLPSDFSGFNLERTPAGSTLPTRTGDGTQALAGQAGVPQGGRSTPQAPRITTPQPDVAPAGASGFTRTGVVSNPNGTTTAVGITPNGAAVVMDGSGTVMTSTAVNSAGGGGAGVNANGSGVGGATAAGVGAAITTFGAQGGGRTFQSGVNSTTANGTTTPGGISSQQGGTTGSRQGTTTSANGTTGTAVPGNTSNAQPANTGTVNMQGTSAGTVGQNTPPATQTGSVGAQSNPPATQTGTVGAQGTPTATQTGGQTTTPVGGAQRSPSGALTTSGVQANSVGNSTTSTATTAQGAAPIGSGANGAAGTTGTATGGNAQPNGASGGPSAGGGASGTGGGAPGGSSSGGGTSGGGSSGGGGTSGGSSGGGTSGGAGGGPGGGGT